MTQIATNLPDAQGERHPRPQPAPLPQRDSAPTAHDRWQPAPVDAGMARQEALRKRALGQQGRLRQAAAAGLDDMLPSDKRMYLQLVQRTGPGHLHRLAAGNDGGVAPQKPLEGAVERADAWYQQKILAGNPWASIPQSFIGLSGLREASASLRSSGYQHGLGTHANPRLTRAADMRAGFDTGLSVLGMLPPVGAASRAASTARYVVTADGARACETFGAAETLARDVRPMPSQRLVAGAPRPGELVVAGQGTSARALPGNSLHAAEAFKMHIPGLGDTVAKVETFDPVNGTRTYIESLTHHVDSLLPAADGGTQGTLVPRTWMAVLEHDVATSGRTLPAGSVVSAQEFKAGVNLRDPFHHYQSGRLGFHPDMVRLNFLDHLMGNLDRHTGNIIWSPESDTLHAIDNGLAGQRTAESLSLRTPDLPYADYPQVKDWHAGLDATERKLAFLHASRAYAEKALPALDDRAIQELVAKHKAMVMSPAFQQACEASGRPEAAEDVLADLDQTYDIIMHNKQAILPLIDRHIEMLGGSPAAAPAVEEGATLVQ